MDEKISNSNLDFLGTRRFLPAVVSATFSCTSKTFGARARDECYPFAAAAAPRESSNGRAKEAEPVVGSPPSEEATRVEEEINRIVGDCRGGHAWGGVGPASL